MLVRVTSHTANEALVRALALPFLVDRSPWRVPRCLCRTRRPRSGSTLLWPPDPFVGPPEWRGRTTAGASRRACERRAVLAHRPGASTGDDTQQGWRCQRARSPSSLALKLGVFASLVLRTAR